MQEREFFANSLEFPLCALKWRLNDFWIPLSLLKIEFSNNLELFKKKKKFSFVKFMFLVNFS